MTRDELIEQQREEIKELSARVVLQDAQISSLLKAGEELDKRIAELDGEKGISAMLAAIKDEERDQLRAELAALNAKLDASKFCASVADDLRAELDAIKAQEPVQVDYVAVMRDNGDGDLEPEWLMEGGTAEMMDGMYLCCIDYGALLFEEGSGQIYAAPVQAVVTSPHFCGGTMSKNPHPDAGVPEHICTAGTVYECIPCLVKSRHDWSVRSNDFESRLRDLLAAPVAKQVVMPERKDMTRGFDAQRTFAMGWNACLDEVASLNAAPETTFCEYCGGNDEHPQDHCMDCARPNAADQGGGQ